MVNAHQLFEILLSAKQKLDLIIKQNYKEIEGPKLTSRPPQIMAPLMSELETIVRVIVPEYPPPEPPNDKGQTSGFH